MIQERKKSSPEAVARRRLSRQFKFQKDAYRQRERDLAKRQQTTFEAAFRVVERAIDIERAEYQFRRSVRGKVQPQNDIRELPEYWLLRRFGYDVRSKEFTQFIRADGAVSFIAPAETDLWKWWTGPELSQLVKQISDGKVTSIRAMRKIIAERYPNNIITAVADAESARRKHAKYLAERNLVNPL